MQPSLNPIGTPTPQFQVSADTRLICARCTRTITQSDAVFTVWLRKLSTGWQIAAGTWAKARRAMTMLTLRLVKGDFIVT